MNGLIAGLDGSGKTAFLSRMVRSALADERDVWSYRDFKFADDRVQYFDNIQEVSSKKRCLVVIDEAQEHFDSREWELLPKSFRLKLSAVRHCHMDIWAATQDATFVDTRFRRVVKQYFEIKRVAGTKLWEDKHGVEHIEYPWYAPFYRKPWQLSWIRRWDIRRSDNVTRGSLWDEWRNGRYLLFNKKDFDFFDSYVEYGKTAALREDKEYDIRPAELWTCKTCGARKYKNASKKLPPEP